MSLVDLIYNVFYIGIICCKLFMYYFIVKLLKKKRNEKELN